MTLHFIYIIIVSRYLRTTLKTNENYIKWNSILTTTTYLAVGLLILGLLYKPLDPLLLWISQIALLLVTWLLYSLPELKSARLLLIAILPYVIITFLGNVIKLFDTSLYNSWHNFFDSVTTFAVIWLIGTWLLIRNQNKELEKARQKAILEEENSRTVSAINERLEKQVAQRTAELTKQKENLEEALTELKSTQSQLIQSEKMASLGELTAGIAHEIQNPLNFVNNFSEVSIELIAEMKEELGKGNTEEVMAIAEDLEKNLDRITQHGKRADGIVKSMLQHSRKNTGQREPTNINAIADEYLRLSFHGLRAKDKTFNSSMQTDFDPSIGSISIVPQDIGRVLLNLFNNAFYSVNEKKKTTNDPDYKPLVFVSTKKKDDNVEIMVKDNGNGIPQTIIDKIFQPFFSTKPTGQGTGLGLSLSYDIITRQHGGTIKAETEEGKGASFIINLPVN